MAEAPSIASVPRARNTSDGRALRRLCLWAGVVCFALLQTLFLLFFLVEPPVQGSRVTPFQDFCLFGAIGPYVLFLLCILLSVIGVILPSTRRQMWLALGVNAGLLLLMMGIMAIVAKDY